MTKPTRQPKNTAPSINPALLEGGVTRTHPQNSTFADIDHTIDRLREAQASTDNEWLQMLIQIKLIESQAELVMRTVEEYYAVR
jgi:hypothetical protein